MRSRQRVQAACLFVACTTFFLAGTAAADRSAVFAPSLTTAHRATLHTNAALQPLLGLRGGSMMESWRGMMRTFLSKLGIFTKKGQLLVIGLDNAGKSTLLTMLLKNKVVPHEPTHQPVTDEIKIGALKLRAVDMGGHAIARRMWRQYSQEADAVVFIVDAADRERFQEAAIELHKLLAGNSLPPHAPVLILGNKVDLPQAVREEELYWCLGLDALSRSAPNQAPRPIQLFMCSVFEGRGFPEGLEWLASCVK